MQGRERTRGLQPMLGVSSHRHSRGAASGAPSSGNWDTRSQQGETICTSSTSKIRDAKANGAAFGYL